MASRASQFICQQCGHAEPKWAGQCPSCGEWNSLVETSVSPRKSKFKVQNSKLSNAEPIRLSSIKKSDYSKRLSTKISELDRVLGGGVVPGSVTLVAGEPGVGKSTLLLQVASSLAESTFKVKSSLDNLKGCLYVAGEESAGQIAGRAARLGVKGDNIEVLEETDVDAVLEVLSGGMWKMGSELGSGKMEAGKDTHLAPLTSKPTSHHSHPISLIIVDSIQTMTTGDLSGGAGSVGQVRECASRLSLFAKAAGIPLFMVGHVTKEGTIAGPRVLEHMVDTVLWFEGDRQEILRILRTVKNRFGATDEVGIFSMEEKGLVEVSNPAEFFLGSRPGLEGKDPILVPGSVATVLMEGTRPLLVEVQALVVPTKLAFPKRVASGIDSRRLELLVAVLTRRAGLPLWDFDIFVNAAGGLRVREPAADLAVALSIASAFQDKPVVSSRPGLGRKDPVLVPGLVAVGEVGLLGEVRGVLQAEKRIKEARRLGFRNVATSKEVKTVSQAIRKYISSQ